MNPEQSAPGYGRNVARRKEAVLFSVRRELVSSVARTYANILNVSTVVSSTPDHLDRSPRWTPTLAHYKIDVENIVRKTFAGRADSEELAAAWNRLFGAEDGFDVIGDIEQRVIFALSSAFHHANMHPRQYFRTTRVYNQKPVQGAAA